MKKFVSAMLFALAFADAPRAVTLNGAGQVAQGVGGGIAAVDNREISRPAGGTAFVTDGSVVYQVCEGVCRIEEFDIHSGAKRTVAERGANDLYAGGGVWAAWLGGVGVFTSTGQAFPESGLGPISPDGAIALKVLRNSFGPWDVLEQNGSRWRLADCDAHDIQLLGQRRGVFMCGTQVRAQGLSAPTALLPGTIWWTRTAFVNGQPWVMYQSEQAAGRLVVHPYDSLQGYVVTQGGDSFRPDFMQLGNRLRVAYAVRESEAPGEVIIKDIDLASPRTNIGTLVTTTAPPPVVVVVPPTPPQTAPSQKGTVERIRKKYDTPLGTRHWEFLVEVAQAVGGKLFRKDGGDRVFVPALNFSVSQDIIIVGTEWIDILGDAERTASPSWEAHPNAGEPEKWIDVSGIKIGTSVPPPAEGIAELQRQLDVANSQLARLHDAHMQDAATIAELQRQLNDESDNIAALQQARDELKTQLAAERAKPAPQCTVSGVPSWARSLGVRASCQIVR